MTDEELLGAAYRAFEKLDPPPVRLAEAARRAFEFRDPDAALAELTAALTPAAAGLRSGSRLLTFTSPTCTVTVEVSGQGRGRTLVGEVVPAGAAELHVRHRAGESPAEVDATGHFVVPDIPAGPAMLRFGFPDGTTVVTNWAQL